LALSRKYYDLQSLLDNASQLRQASSLLSLRCFPDSSFAGVGGRLSSCLYLFAVCFQRCASNRMLRYQQ
jgi:hypothetical protein